MSKLVKNNNEHQDFSIEKLSKSLDEIFKGHKVHKDDLLREFESIRLTKKQLNSLEIYDLLINQSLKMCNLDNDMINLEWRFIASKLLMKKTYKVVAKNRHYNKLQKYSDYYSFVKLATDLGLYDSMLLDTYTEEEIKEFEKELNPDYDLGYDYAGVNSLINRYLVKKDGKAFELPQEMYLTVSLLLAIPEQKDNRLKVAKDIYNMVASRKISLATPIILNLRVPNGNLASCFINAISDSLDGIYYGLDQIAQISKNAGGVGTNISRIRSNGSYIRDVKGASSGIMPWVKLINDTAVGVNQQGKRSGAVTVALDIWHLDIEDFLHCQTENGDLRSKAFDIFPQIVVPDLFMQRVESNSNWTLVDPNEVKKKYGVELSELYGDAFENLYFQLENDTTLELKKTVNAKELFKIFLKTVVETGMPYVFFKDTVNDLNPNKHVGMVGNCNLCCESWSNFKPSVIGKKQLNEDNSISQKIMSGEVHVCSLISQNLALLEDDDLDFSTSISVRIIDNLIDLTANPVVEAELHNSLYRIIGIGAMGLHDYIVKHKVTYKNSSNLVSSLFENIAYYGLKASMELSKERGSYKAFKGSEFSKGIVFGKNENWFKNNSTFIETDKWISLLNDIKQFGIRNGGIYAIAPNTSTSLLMGCTASVLPTFSKFFIDKASNGSVPIAPPHLSKDTFWYYTENKNMNQQDVIEIISKIQEWTDQGISMELYLNLNNGIKAKDIYNLYMSAWKKKCKTVYYIRSIALKTQKDDCVSCAN